MDFYLLTNDCVCGIGDQQTEIAKRLNAIIVQVLPFLSQEVKWRGNLSFLFLLRVSSLFTLSLFFCFVCVCVCVRVRLCLSSCLSLCFHLICSTEICQIFIRLYFSFKKEEGKKKEEKEQQQQQKNSNWVLITGFSSCNNETCYWEITHKTTFRS